MNSEHRIKARQWEKERLQALGGVVEWSSPVQCAQLEGPGDSQESPKLSDAEKAERIRLQKEVEA